MAKFSVVIFKEGKNGTTGEPFLASRDPEIVRAVRDFIAAKLQKKQSSIQPNKINQEEAQ
jgi:hypothetical protein